ncbi:COG3650 family protein [Erythrobacter sp. HL-111]|uniref:COG3650 family protein n=1 Tax=Erythrobacter sp. HL-111 TaxID=1798193 RepID=UPI0006DB6BC9|nr:hypothetical protein [Erythrobacter sp. HL-111]KPP87971.1 MAG: putative membrane protein [Erythrobacteraceae bacterium HL-111]SDS42779.1 Uncharacterized membrane protein [Erythrobacter sp. HL-111]
MPSSPTRPASAVLAACLVLAACAGEEGDAIGRDTEPFSGIAEDEVIEVTGNEPFWGMTIDQAAGVAAYSTPENIDGTRFKAARFAGNNGLGFTGTLASGEGVVVTITPGECSDGMTDRTYPFTATAKIGGRDLEGCAFTDS